jgi:hypothetical protein
MTYDELVEELDGWIRFLHDNNKGKSWVKAIRSVVELHKPVMQWSGGYDGEENPLYAEQCSDCSSNGFTQEYPCQTIQAIRKELQ